METRPNGVRIATVLIALLIAGMAVERMFNSLAISAGLESVLAGDPSVYEMRWLEISSGNLPYVKAEFEHFPLTLIPMAIAGWLGEGLGITYTAAWAIVAAVMIGLSVAVVRSTGEALEDDGILNRYLWMLTPLLPLVLFRTDVLPALLASLAFLGMIRRREANSFVSVIGGVLAKGWPVVLAVVDWWRGRRARAIAILVFTFALVALLLTMPGFQSGRSFMGVHQETISGSLILVWRHITGSDLGVISHASAVYLDAGLWAVLLNLALGGVVAMVTLMALQRSMTWPAAATLLAGLILGMILASPLLSAQFLLWPIAFMAVQMKKRVMWAMFAVSAVSIVLLGLWDREALWWAVLLLGRNLLLVLVAILTALRAAGWTTRPLPPRVTPASTR